MPSVASADGSNLLGPNKGGGGLSSYSGSGGGFGGVGSVSAPKFTPPGGMSSTPGLNNIVPFKSPPAPNLPTFSPPNLPFKFSPPSNPFGSFLGPVFGSPFGGIGAFFSSFFPSPSIPESKPPQLKPPNFKPPAPELTAFGRYRIAISSIANYNPSIGAVTKYFNPPIPTNVYTSSNTSGFSFVNPSTFNVGLTGDLGGNTLGQFPNLIAIQGQIEFVPNPPLNNAGSPSPTAPPPENFQPLKNPTPNTSPPPLFNPIPTGPGEILPFTSPNPQTPNTPSPTPPQPPDPDPIPEPPKNPPSDPEAPPPNPDPDPDPNPNPNPDPTPSPPPTPPPSPSPSPTPNPSPSPSPNPQPNPPIEPTPLVPSPPPIFLPPLEPAPLPSPSPSPSPTPSPTPSPAPNPAPKPATPLVPNPNPLPNPNPNPTPDPITPPVPEQPADPIPNPQEPTPTPVTPTTPTTNPAQPIPNPIPTPLNPNPGDQSESPNSPGKILDFGSFYNYGLGDSGISGGTPPPPSVPNTGIPSIPPAAPLTPPPSLLPPPAASSPPPITVPYTPVPSPPTTTPTPGVAPPLIAKPTPAPIVPVTPPGPIDPCKAENIDPCTGKISDTLNLTKGLAAANSAALAALAANLVGVPTPVKTFVKCENNVPVFGVQIVQIPFSMIGFVTPLYEKIANTEGRLCAESNAIATVPEWWQLRPEANRPQGILVFKEVRPDGTIGKDPYAITIPHCTLTAPPNTSPLTTYKKGSFEGILTLKDNSKLIVNCKDAEECDRVITALSEVIKSTQLEGSSKKIGQRKGQPFKQIEVKAQMMHYYPTGAKSMKPAYIKSFF